MLARCPSCGGQVEESDDVCSSCGWDFATRQRRPGHPGAKPPAEPPKQSPAQTPSKETGRGLVQFPKIEPEQLKQGAGKGDDAPFTIPSFAKGEPLPPPPAALPPSRAEKKEPPGEGLEPTPLASELEERAIPEPPKTVMRRSEAEPARPSKPEPSRRTDPPKKKPTPAAEMKPPMGAFIGLASAAVLAIASGGIYMLTRSGEQTASASHRAGRPFEEGATGAKPAIEAPPVKPVPPQSLPMKPIEKAPAPPAAPAPVVELPKPQPKPKPKPAPAPAPKPAAPPPNVAPEWQFQGTAYDVITLAPVAAAKMSFRVPGGREFTCQTDAKGRFKISLAPLRSGSYQLSVGHKQYLDGYIDEMSPSLAEAEVDQRRAIAASNARNDPWVGDVKKPVNRDFYLIPYNLGKK